MAMSRYALHEEGEGSPFAGSLFCDGFLHCIATKLQKKLD